MKKLAVKKGAECMACLQCVTACSEAFYKQADVTLSCIQREDGSLTLEWDEFL